MAGAKPTTTLVNGFFCPLVTTACGLSAFGFVGAIRFE